MCARGTTLWGRRCEGALQRRWGQAVLAGVLLVGFSFQPFRTLAKGDKPFRLGEDTWRSLPFRFEVLEERKGNSDGRILLVDFDRDGVTEWLYYPDPAESQKTGPLPEAVFELRDIKHKDLWLFNILGRVWVCGVMVGDALPEQPGNELLVTYGQGDSVFLAVYNPRRYRSLHLLYTNPWPPKLRRKVRWRGRAEPCLLRDLDGDGRRDLIMWMTTAHSLYPRGILVYDFAKERVLWRFDTGCQVGDAPAPLLADLDKDGRKELVFGGSSPANGAKANGTEDRYTYLIVLDAATGQKRLVKRVGAHFGQATVLDADSSTGEVYFLFSDGRGATKNESFLGVLRYPDTTIYRRLPLHSTAHALAWDVDHDGQLEFLVARERQRDLTLFDRNFAVMRRQTFVSRVRTPMLIDRIQDVNQDLNPEIVSRLDTRVTFLDLELRPFAQFPEDESQLVGLIHDGTGRPPLLLLRADFPGGKRTYYTVRLRRQFVWPLPISWQGTLLILLGFAFVGAAVVVQKGFRRRDTNVRTLQRSLEFVPHGVVLLNLDGLITFCNGPARELLHLEDMVVEGRHFEKAFAGKALNPLREILRKSFRGEEQRYRHRLVLELPTGESRHLVATITRIHGRGRHETGRMLILYDSSRLPGSAQAEDWVAIARRVAHEIKNPLSTILLTAQRLQMEYRKRDPSGSKLYDTFTERIIGRVEYLEKVTQGFLKLLRLENPNFSKCDFAELVEMVIREFELGIPENVRLRYQREEPIPHLLADPDQLRSLVENLLTNAIAAMPGGGVVTVLLRLERRLQHPGSPGTTVRDFVLLRVRDTGRGMPEEIARALMEAASGKGANSLGIGLTIVSKVVRTHEGFIDVLTEEGVGTTVDVYLPI